MQRLSSFLLFSAVRKSESLRTVKVVCHLPTLKNKTNRLTTVIADRPTTSSYASAVSSTYLSLNLGCKSIGHPDRISTTRIIIIKLKKTSRITRIVKLLSKLFFLHSLKVFEHKFFFHIYSYYSSSCTRISFLEKHIFIILLHL